ncbi:hypothetical protein [Vibrio sp. VPAP30]|uniref:hypothetical protein n=1 Tax=Vibrio sp. VPAP30 TaxID=1647102 RepID=UPI0006763704|nr:hypothetical protein [Vibrio sp. VPAP30]
MMRLGSFLLLLISNSLIASELDVAYEKLNDRTDSCLSLQKRSIQHVNDAWLSSLSDFELKVILLELNRSALTRCVETEFKDYTYHLFQKSISSGDAKPLNVWFELNSRNQPEDYKSVANRFADEILTLSKSGTFNLPFDTKAYFDTIRASLN